MSPKRNRNVRCEFFLLIPTSSVEGRDTCMDLENKNTQSVCTTTEKGQIGTHFFWKKNDFPPKKIKRNTLSPDHRTGVSYWHVSRVREGLRVRRVSVWSRRYRCSIHVHIDTYNFSLDEHRVTKMTEVGLHKLSFWRTNPILRIHTSTHPMLMILTLTYTQVHGFFLQPNLCSSGSRFYETYWLLIIVGVSETPPMDSLFLPNNVSLGRMAY